MKIFWIFDVLSNQIFQQIKNIQSRNMDPLEEPVKLLPYHQDLYRVVKELLAQQPHLDQNEVRRFTQRLDDYFVKNGWIDPEQPSDLPPLESFDADIVTK
jgi:hypothetical protein